MENNKITVIGLVAVGILALVFLGTSNVGAPESAINDLIGDEGMVIYKTASCGCCEVYSSYLKKEGVSVDVRNITDLDEIKEEFGIPSQLRSCHTSEVGGYVIEGHVPLEVISKLLTEKPQIKGIALPGMPSGSPGMPGPKVAPFVIYTLGGAEGEIYITI